MLELVVRYFHFIGIFLLFGCVLSQNIIIKRDLAEVDIQRLVRIENFYAIGAMTTFIAGLTLWFGVGKYASFYSQNPVFHIKLTLFVVVGLCSLFPTRFIRRASRTKLDMPSWLILMKRIELLVLLIFPALAVMIARGIGLK